ncbi:NAD-dependent protein deacetylase sirtuin-7 [Diorhabda sublineata]|uniref:NAD-dependent protein deacetylase sirtuin-7 n=1 Tax=Diorhabda sublineata TaxID=1163346 RepID=UPI0024E186C4|nr:NAD-dependent protein deacetylase sirtuin-7 [Diorhabda sublineata]
MDEDITENAISETDVEAKESCPKRFRLPRKSTIESTKKLCAKEERIATVKKVSYILQKIESDRTLKDKELLAESQDIVEEIHNKWKKRNEAKRRLEELEDPEDILNNKCHILAQAIAQSQYLVAYTGAGISTAAEIPDYRGTNGIWTRLQQGKDIGNYDLSVAEPTYTHMALAELYRKNILKHVVSQNCDGLHLRSGLPRTALSELHGNMYIEVCKQCKPVREYWRYFDVTENTARFSHKTYRRCYVCNGPLTDTIVHFGERGDLQWPLNWAGACKNASKATTVICLGSSLKVLKKYPWLWQMEKPVKKRANLYIINLQWTPKDEFANVKVNGKCDIVMKKIMNLLGILVPKYEKLRDPMYSHATDMHPLELHTTTQTILKLDESVQKDMLYNKDCVANKMPDLSENETSITCDSSNKTDILPKQENDSSINFPICSIIGTKNIQTVSLPQTDTKYFFSSDDSFLNSNFFKDLNNYSDLFLYPYETSFLYSGLHSIINPVPTFEEDFYSKEAKVGKIEPACNYCFKYFTSTTCLFYIKTEPVFLNVINRFSKLEKKKKPNVCLCCDYSTDEEEVDNVTSEKDTVKIRAQAGWFGKGYRKGRRAKRRSI